MDKAQLNRAYFQTGDWARMRYKGIPIFKYAQDLYLYEEILRETKPDVIIECGTLEGGFSLWLKDHSMAEVITIDIKAPDIKQPGIKYYLGSSLDFVYTPDPKKKVMVILDSDHRKDHVLAEIKQYAPLVSSGCYLVIEDTFISRYMDNEDGHNDYTGGSSYEAIQIWDKQGFAHDDTLSDSFSISMNLGGWWYKR